MSSDCFLRIRKPTWRGDPLHCWIPELVERPRRRQAMNVPCRRGDQAERGWEDTRISAPQVLARGVPARKRHGVGDAPGIRLRAGGVRDLRLLTAPIPAFKRYLTARRVPHLLHRKSPATLPEPVWVREICMRRLRSLNIPRLGRRCSFSRRMGARSRFDLSFDSASPGRSQTQAAKAIARTVPPRDVKANRQRQSRRERA